MRLLQALVICTFLHQCVLGMDQDELPKITRMQAIKMVETTVETMPAPPKCPRGRHWRRPPPNPILTSIDSKHLKWVRWNGSLPQWAVKVFIPETGQENYICVPLSDRCHRRSGYYNPSKGSYCFKLCSYSPENMNGDPQFEVLVNEQNLEQLEWKTYEGVGDHENGMFSNIYGITLLGKNRYGIGCLVFLDIDVPILVRNDGRVSSTFTKSFDILVVSQTGQYTQKLHDMQYQVDGLNLLSQQPTVLSQMRTSNHNCHDIEEEVELQKDTERQSTWEPTSRGHMRFGMTGSVSTSVEVSVPLVSSSDFALIITAFTADSSPKTLTKSNVTETLKDNLTEILNSNLTETVGNSLTVKIKVPPNHSCLVKMTGMKFTFNGPFTARLSKMYTDGRVHTVTVNEMYHGIQVGEIEAVTERCEPLPNPAPCGH